MGNGPPPPLAALLVTGLPGRDAAGASRVDRELGRRWWWCVRVASPRLWGARRARHEPLRARRLRVLHVDKLAVRQLIQVGGSFQLRPPQHEAAAEPPPCAAAARVAAAPEVARRNEAPERLSAWMPHSAGTHRAGAAAAAEADAGHGGRLLRRLRRRGVGCHTSDACATAAPSQIRRSGGRCRHGRGRGGGTNADAGVAVATGAATASPAGVGGATAPGQGANGRGAAWDGGRPGRVWSARALYRGGATVVIAGRGASCGRSEPSNLCGVLGALAIAAGLGRGRRQQRARRVLRLGGGTYLRLVGLAGGETRGGTSSGTSCMRCPARQADKYAAQGAARARPARIAAATRRCAAAAEPAAPQC